MTEIEELLLVHEARLNKFHKQMLVDSPSINYTQENIKSFSSHGSDSYTVPNKNLQQSEPESFPNYPGGSSGGGSFNRGGGQSANFHCQVSKIGQTASVGHYRFDQHTINNVQLWFFMTLPVKTLQRIIQASHRTTSILDMLKITLVKGRTVLILALLVPGIGLQTTTIKILPVLCWLETNAQSQPNSANWIPDSGASFHVTGESQNIQQIEPFEGPDQFIGNGLPITSSGSSTFISPHNSNVSLFFVS